MSSTTNTPHILLSIARNPVTAVGLPLALGTLSGWPSKNIAEGYWYRSLAKPVGEPPGQAIPIVWPFLYMGMGYASHLAVKALDSSLSPDTRGEVSTALKLYYASLGLNLSWTPIFFIFKRPGLAFLDITALSGIVGYITAKLHGPTGGKSTYFLGPYCAWLAWATYTNGGIWWLNSRKHIPHVD